MATPAVSPSDIHYQTVSQRVPPTLLASTAQTRQALRAQVPPALPWLDTARSRLPEVIKALGEEHQRHEAHAQAVHGFLAQLPDAEAFAEPLLREGLKSTLGLDLDVRHTFLFNAARARLDESRFGSGDPVANAFQLVKLATQPLLLAALQNFEAFEAEDDGMKDGRRPSTIFVSDSGQVLEPSRDLDLAPERFAGLCRTLDLGGRYQRLIDATFNPVPIAGESAEAAATARQAHFRLFEQSTLRLNLHLALLQGWIDRSLYDRLLAQAEGNGGLGGSALYLWDVELHGLVLFEHPKGVVVYMPDEPRQPVQSFASLDEVQASLRERLRDATWRNFFLRFVPARERARLMQRIQRNLYPKVWNAGGWYEERFDAQAALGLSSAALAAPLFEVLLQRKIAALKDDGLFHAVPTAAEDHKSTVDKVEYFLSVGFNVLNVAAFVVPGLGLVMLGVNAALLGYEVYEGFDSLAKGEREEAWGYFMDVAENLAIMAALGGVGAAQQRFTGNLPLAVRSMRPVTLADGSVRLWKPDLTPFAYDIELPAGLQPGENGLYAHEGRQWLRLDGRYYSVRSLLGEASGHVLEHPTRSTAYAPKLRHNGNGGWLHELDAPEQWHGTQLISRLGPMEAGVSEAMAVRALRISGVSEAQLRQSLVDNRRPPALFSDSLRRLSLHDGLQQFALDDSALAAEIFNRAYGELPPPLSLAGRLLQRQFDSLPKAIIEEIVASATPRESAGLKDNGRVPLRLEQEARLYQQQVRIARACEGLYLDIEANPDSARLLLHGLTRLADWPADLRIELYEGSFDGPRLTGIGTGTAPALDLVWNGQLPAAFCQTLHDAIAAPIRTRLGIDDAPGLRRLLQEQPAPPRQRLREWLGLPAAKPGFRSPMRLADGRLGYPLSGRGQPFFTEDQLLDKLRLLELDDLYAEDALQALYRSGLDRASINARLDAALGEMLEMRAHLDRWTLESAREALSESRQHSRERIGAALWAHWRGNLLPELGRAATPLLLWDVQLADLPRDLPAFFRERVDALLLDDVILREGMPHDQYLDEHAVQVLARQFPRLTSLDIRGGQWDAGVTRMLAQAWPQLGALGLREMGRSLEYRDLRALVGLPRLRWLELRGSRIEEMPASALDGLILEHLGLDWLDLRAWPQWLSPAALGRIGELTLAGNRLSELPPDILDLPGTSSRRLRVVLEDNPLGCQALLDLRLAEQVHGRFRFDLDLAPAIEEELHRRLQERAQLLAALQVWSEAPGVPPERQPYRQRIVRLLLEHWREELYLPGTALLYLEDVVLGDFPAHLPEFFTARVRRMELTRFNATTPGSLEQFIQRFPQLTELSLVGGQPALAAAPEFLTRLPLLRELALVRMGMTIDQAAMQVFARIPQLSSLQLDGNRLGEINDMSMFQARFLDYLGLAQMQIAVWPDWLDTLLPRGIELLGLDDNLLIELPPHILENRYAEDGSVDITLRGNPLTRQTMIQAFTSQHYNRPYSFTMNLPEDIAAMEARVHSSDSEQSEWSSGDTAQSLDDPAVTWQTGDAGQDSRHQALWMSLVTQGDAEMLLTLVARLRHSADYRSTNTRAELVARVWVVLAAASQDSELRLALNAMAEEPLQQLHHQETCPDGIRLEFNQMELQVYTRQALRQVGEENRGPALFRLMRGMYRAERLDGIARERANGRDEAEVRLAYRLRWAERLELPLPPRGMLYRGAAEIAPGELDQALIRLQQDEAGPSLVNFAVACDFWVAYLREAFAPRFRVLKEAYEQAVLDLVDLYPDETAEQSAARIHALEAKFKSDERKLLERLTLEQEMAGN